MNTQSTVIDQFLNYLRFEKHFSPYTARCYGADLRQYIEHLDQDVSGDEKNDKIDAIITRADPMVIRGIDRGLRSGASECRASKSLI